MKAVAALSDSRARSSSVVPARPCPRAELGVEDSDRRLGEVGGRRAQHPREGQDGVVAHERGRLLEGGHDLDEIAGQLGLGGHR